MKDNFEQVNEISEPNTCPHLALKGDSQSYAAFPSIINVCYRLHSPVTPKISHQRSFCLTPNYLNCKLFQNDHVQKFPRDLRYNQKGILGNINKSHLVGIFSVLILVVIFLLFLRGETRNKLFGFFPTSAIRAKVTPSEVVQGELSSATPQMNVSVEITTTPKIISTSTPTSQTFPTQISIDPVLALDTPIGSKDQFIIHRVREGESLQLYADRYKTSIEAIIAVNENLIMPLWIDWILVIPLKNENNANMPKFLTYQIQEEGITLKTVADRFAAPLEEISLYNNIDGQHILHEGEWLLVPQE